MSGLTFRHAFCGDDTFTDDLCILLEYQDGSLGQHYLCVEDTDITQVINAFILYLHSDERWKTQLMWEHFPVE